MARPIAESAWRNFLVELNGSTRYDGLLFEGLVRDLLARFFAGTWEATAKSWDGGRDFVDRTIAGNEQWAECKMYRTNVGIRVLSPTLVMAIIERVRSLLLFSYSDVNGPAKRHIARLGRDQSMKIRLYDGATLDRLILAAPDICERYFGPEAKAAALDRAPIWLSGRLTRDLEFELGDLDCVGRDSPASELPLDLYAPVVLEVFVKNQHARESLQCTFDLSPFADVGSPLHRALDDAAEPSERIELDPGEMRGLRYVLRANLAGLHEMPPLALGVRRAGGEREVVEIPFATKRVRASLIRHPPLIGAAYLRDLADLANAIALTGRFTTSLVHGRTGVGKSRYLEELGYRLIAAGRSVVQITPRNVRGLGWRDVMRSIVARLSAMPDPRAFSSQAAAPGSGEEAHASDPRDPVTHFLYGIDTEADAAFVERAVDIVRARLAISPRILLVDDLQGFDREIVGFLRRLDGALHGTTCQSALVIGVNADLVGGNQAAAAYFADLLGALDAAAPGTGRTIKIAEFTAGQVDEFIDNLLESGPAGRARFSDDYPELMRQVREKVEPRPLALWQLIHLWVDRGILVATERFFFIADLDGLRRSLDEAWRLLEGILAQRVVLLRRRPEEWAVLQLAVLYGELTPFDTHDLDIPVAVVDRLVDDAFMRRNGADEVEFYHEAVARGLHHAVAEPDETALGRFRHTWSGECRARVWRRRPIAAYNLDIAFGLAALQPELVLKACTLAASPTLQSQRAARHVLESARVWAETVTLLPSILGLTRHAGMLDGRAGQTRLLIQLAPEFADFRPGSATSARQFSRLIASTASQSLSDGFRGEAKSYLESWESRLTLEIRSRRVSPYARDLRARVRNRMCVLYKDLGLPAEAVRRAKQSLRDCAGGRNPFLACLNLVDLGYVHYGARESSDEARRAWGRAVALFQSERPRLVRENSESALFIGLVAALCKAMAGEPGEARADLERVAEQARLENNLYYQLQASVMGQILALHCALATTRALNGHQQALLQGGFQALEDRAATLRVSRFLAPIQYGRAICLMAATEPDWSGAAALLDSLLKGAESRPCVSPIRRAILYDWIVAMTRLEGRSAAERLSARRLAMLGPPSRDALRCRPAPALTTFWINGINLPYA